MLYVTTASFSLVSYHIKESIKIQPIIIREVTEPILRECLSHMGTITGPGNMENIVYLLDWAGDKPPTKLEQSLGNTVYLVVNNNLGDWRPLLKKPWIERLSLKPEMYRGNLEALRAMFTTDAFEYFWNELCLGKFNSSPYKWNLELTSLLVRRSNQDSRFTVEQLKDIYDMVNPNLFQAYVNNIGTEEGDKVLHRMSMGELWTLFIGNFVRAPFLHRYLVDKKEGEALYIHVMLLQQAVAANVMDFRTGTIVLNSFWRDEISLQKVKRVQELEIDSEGIKKLTSLLHLT